MLGPWSKEHWTFWVIESYIDRNAIDLNVFEIPLLILKFVYLKSNMISKISIEITN